MRTIFRKTAANAHCKYAASILASYLLSIGSAVAAEHWEILESLYVQPDLGGHFGAAVAMSGNTLAIGAPLYANGTANAAGVVYVYQRSGRFWSLLDTFTGSVPNAHFGAAVAVSGDSLIIGAPDSDNGTVASAGSLYFYRRNTATGHWQGALSTTSNGSGDRLGASVAISATKAVAGAPGRSTGSVPNAGKIFTYDLVTNAWAFTGELSVTSPATGNKVGASVALYESTSASTAPVMAVGAPGFDTASVMGAGAVFVFSYGASGWQQIAGLLEQNPHTGDALGTSVAVGAQRVFGGSPTRDNPNGAMQSGSVSVFLSGAASYTFEDELFASGGSTGARFGASMAFDFDGTLSRLLIGAPLGNESATVLDSGAAYVFERFGSPVQWREDQRLSFGVSAQSNQQLGSSVAVSGVYAAAGIPNVLFGAAGEVGGVETFLVDGVFADGFD